MDQALKFVEGIAHVVEVGAEYDGTVTRLMNFGAFVEIYPGTDGLVHISQLADRFVESPSSVVKVGQHVTVTVLEVDVDRHRVSLSMKKQPT